MAHADLLTKCGRCRETLVIPREAAMQARPVVCHYCGETFYLGPLLGVRQEAPLPEPLAGTWEGARP